VVAHAKAQAEAARGPVAGAGVAEAAGAVAVADVKKIEGRNR